MHRTSSFRSAAQPVARFLLAAVLAVVASCAESAPRAPVAAYAPGAFPRTIEVPGGGPLRIERAPQRVVPANAGAFDLLTELIGPERVAAWPRQIRAYSVLAEAPAGELARWEALPSYERYLAEPLLAVAADLVVSDPWGALETTARLREAGIAVLELPDIATLADVTASLRALAAALGREERAEEVIAGWRAREQALRKRNAGRGASAIAYSYYGSQGACSGADSTLAEVFALCGLTNAAGHLRGHAPLSFEQLLALDPHWILVARLGEGEGVGGTGALLRSDPVLARLRAVREQRVLELSPRLFASTSQQMLEAAERLSERLEAAREGGRE
jgi:iron complex transport system substrate-binding protein